MRLSRRELLELAVAATGLGGALALAPACGGGDDDGGGGGGGACSSQITPNHGHTLSVSQADIDAGQNKTYSIRGTSSHDHQVTITANHFSTLASGGSISLTSTDGGGHSHSVTVQCG